MLILGGSGNDTLSGNFENDTIRLFEGNDSSNGFGGNDWLYGGLGSDTLDGGAGRDVLAGDAGNDVLFAGLVSGDFSGNTLRGGSGHDRLWGSNGRDVLMGGAGVDTIDGGDGNDVAVGGRGKDFLDDSDGADRFVFDDFDSGVGRLRRDEIFLLRVDLGAKIDLRQIDANTALIGDQDFVYIGESRNGIDPFTAAGQVRILAINASNGTIIRDPGVVFFVDFLIQANTGGTLAPDVEIYVSNVPSDAAGSANWFLL